MKRRTAFLGAIAGVLAIGDSIFAFMKVSESQEISRYLWIAHMPELEKAQVAAPELLRSSEHVDPRVHTWFAVEEEPLFTFPKLASECRIGLYLIVLADAFWPDNFYFTELNDGQIDCLSKKLPAGYRVTKLERPLLPSQFTLSPFPIE
jgi:hypothetical protein